MMIKFWIGVLVALAIAILVIFLFAKGFKLMKKKPAVGGVIGFFVGCILFILYFIIPSRVYVVTGEQEYDHYVLLGSSEFKFSNGDVMTVDNNFRQCTIINNTDNRVMFEEIVYGGYGFSPDPLQVSGMTAANFNAPSIDYFFEDAPPDEVSVSNNSDEVSRFWLRRARD